MTSERLLNMSIKFYTSQKIYTPKTNIWIRPCRYGVCSVSFTADATQLDVGVGGVYLIWA